MDCKGEKPGPRGQTVAQMQAKIQTLLTRKDVGLREQVLWRMLYETAARPHAVLELNVEDLTLADRRANVRHKNGAVGTVEWQPDTGSLLSSLLGDRSTGPVFLARYPGAGSKEPGARLSYRRASELLAEATTDEQGRHITFRQLHRFVLIRAVQNGASIPELMALSGYTSMRSLERLVRG